MGNGAAMNRPDIVIVLTTYFPAGAFERVDTAIRTMGTWREYLRYEGNIRIERSDDGSPAEMCEYFHRRMGEADDGMHPPGNWRGWRHSGSTHQRGGVGRSLNAGFAAAFGDSRHAPLALYAVDDWRLDAPFDLTPWADVLLENSRVGCVRFFPHPHAHGGFVKNFRTGWAIEFDRSGYYWAQRPALYHRRFLDHYGAFPEGVSALDVDQIYNDRVCGDQSGPSVVLALPQAWDHDDRATVPLGHLVPGLDQ